MLGNFFCFTHSWLSSYYRSLRDVFVAMGALGKTAVCFSVAVWICWLFGSASVYFAAKDTEWIAKYLTTADSIAHRVWE